MVTLQEFWEWFQGNWQPPFYILFFAFAGQISKRFVFTPERIAVWAWYRDELWNAGGAKRVPGAILKLVLATPLPLHPWLVAIVVALWPLLPMPAGLDNDIWHREFVMQGCALLSLSAYDITHAILQQRGLDFRLPGEAPRRPWAAKHIENMPVGGYPRPDDGNDDLG